MTLFVTLLPQRIVYETSIPRVARYARNPGLHMLCRYRDRSFPFESISFIHQFSCQ